MILIEFNNFRHIFVCFILTCFVLIYNLAPNKIDRLNKSANALKLIFFEEIKPASSLSNCSCKRDTSIVLYKYESETIYRVNLTNNRLNTSQFLYEITGDEFNSANFTCDLYNALRRGKSQQIIGYSLFGKDRFYYEKLANISEQAKRLYPHWHLRIYYDDSIDKSFVCQMECSIDDHATNVDFCYFKTIGLNFKKKDSITKTNSNFLKVILPTMWRFFLIGDSFVNVFLNRDSDSYILQREIDAVNVWLTKSNRTNHIMRDHPKHRAVMLAGMWGFYNARNRTLANYLYAIFKDPRRNALVFRSKKSGDQKFLAQFIFPLIKNDSLIHDAFYCDENNRSNGSIPYPTKRKGSCFIGGKKMCNENRNLSMLICPPKCRPIDHKDWTYC